MQCNYFIKAVPEYDVYNCGLCKGGPKITFPVTLGAPLEQLGSEQEEEKQCFDEAIGARYREYVA